MKGVYWGRFNPPHGGHLKLIKKILQEVDFLFIVIGSAQERNTKRNPFSGKERKMMMEAYLKELKVDMEKIKVVVLNDTKSYMSSFKKLISKLGKFDVVYADKESIIKSIGNKYKVRRIIRRGEISSTRIREGIANDKKWEYLTGKSVAKLIKRFNGIERIKKTYNSEMKVEI